MSPIIPETDDLHNQLQRTQVEQAGILDDNELIERLGQEHQALCIVNTTAHAMTLAQGMADDPDLFPFPHVPSAPPTGAQ